MNSYKFLKWPIMPKKHKVGSTKANVDCKHKYLRKKNCYKETNDPNKNITTEDITLLYLNKLLWK